MVKTVGFQVGEIVTILYARAKREAMGCKLHMRHAKILQLPLENCRGPKNVLVMLRGGVKVVVPRGQLKSSRF